MRTDSGTFCSLIDSLGGGAAGKGSGMPASDDPIELRERAEVGEPVPKCRGGDTRLTDERRERDEGEALRDDDGEGGDPAIDAKLVENTPPRGGETVAPLMSTPRPESPLRSRERLFDAGLSSPDWLALSTLARPLARPTDVRTRAARAVRDTSCSGLLSRGSWRARERGGGRGVDEVSPAGVPASGSSTMPVGGESSSSERAIVLAEDHGDGKTRGRTAKGRSRSR